MPARPSTSNGFGAVAGDGIGAAVRRAAQRGDAFGGLIGLREHCLDLRVEHLVHGDEVGPGHVPVSVLQDQRGLLLWLSRFCRMAMAFSEAASSSPGTTNASVIFVPFFWDISHPPVYR